MIAAAAALLGFGATAHAMATASAELRNLSFTLVDLDSNDGIAPGVTFGGSSLASAKFDDYANSLFPSQSLNGSGLFAPVSAAVATSHGHASARVSGDGTPGGAVATATGSAFSPKSRVDNWFFAYANPLIGTITLTPQTGLLIAADASVSATTTVGFDAATVFYELAYASADIFIYTEDYFDYVELFEYAQFQGELDFVNGNPGQSFSNSGALALRLDNASELASTYNIEAFAAVAGASSFPIPEPASYALVIAGLGAIWLVLRRRGI